MLLTLAYLSLSITAVIRKYPTPSNNACAPDMIPVATVFGIVIVIMKPVSSIDWTTERNSTGRLKPP